MLPTAQPLLSAVIGLVLLVALPDVSALVERVFFDVLVEQTQESRQVAPEQGFPEEAPLLRLVPWIAGPTLPGIVGFLAWTRVGGGR